MKATEGEIPPQSPSENSGVIRLRNMAPDDIHQALPFSYKPFALILRSFLMIRWHASFRLIRSFHARHRSTSWSFHSTWNRPDRHLQENTGEGVNLHLCYCDIIVIQVIICSVLLLIFTSVTGVFSPYITDVQPSPVSITASPCALYFHQII